MLNFLRRAFTRQLPPTHLDRLIEEAEKTGDDARLMAETMIKWSWDVHDATPGVASASEFVENMTSNGYKPAHQLTPTEANALSPQKMLICKSLESIQKTGHLEAYVGQALREFSETGQLPTTSLATREPKAFN